MTGGLVVGPFTRAATLPDPASQASTVHQQVQTQQTAATLLSHSCRVAVITLTVKHMQTVFVS